MALEEGTQFNLYVTHIEGEGPNMKVFGQIDKNRAIMIESLLSDAKPNLEGGLGQTTITNIKVGILCIAKYGDGDYYRARITSILDISSGLISVYFVDYGNNDVVHVSCIRILKDFPDVFRNTPPQARDFLLARISHPNGVWEPEMQASLDKLIYYEEIACVIEMAAFEKYFIKMNYKGQDLADFLASRNFGAKISLQDQRNMLQKVLSSTKSMHHEPNRMYVPPAARLAVAADLNFSRDAFRGYTPPQMQGTTVDMGKIPQQQARAKVRSVIPPRPLHRSVEEVPAPAAHPSQSFQQASASSSSFSQAPTTYHSRHLKENDSFLVHVSYAKDGPKCFAIQLKSDVEFLSNIVSHINSVPPLALTGPPMIGSVCLGRFSEDKTLCRAVVLSSTESHCKLFFVDFGITENVSFTDVFQISENDVKPHVFALRFSLSGISKMQVTEKIKNDFHGIVNNQVLTLKVVPPEGPPLIQYCELYLNGKCVKEMLLQKQNPTFTKINAGNIVGVHLVLVSYVDSCTKFYIQLSKNIDELNEVMDQVSAHCQKSQPLLYHQVRCGMSCCALFPDDQSWYRAIVTNIKKDKITVNYVDYGNEQELTCDMMRAITPELVMLKAQAVHCALKGFEDKPFDQRTCDQLEQLTLEKILSMNVFGLMEGGVLLVDLSDENTIPPTHIASAVQYAAMAPSPVQDPFTSTPQSTSENEAGLIQGNQLVTQEPVEDNASDTSFGSHKGNNPFSSRSKNQYQERERGGKYDNSPRRGYQQDKKRDFGEKTNKFNLKGSGTDYNRSTPHYSTESTADKRNYRKSSQENTSHDAVSKSQQNHKWDTKPDWSNKNQRGDRGRNFSDGSGDKEFYGEKKSYGGDRERNFPDRSGDKEFYGEKKSYGGDRGRNFPDRSGDKEFYGEKKSYGGDRGRNFPDRSGDKEFYGEKKSYGGDRQNKPYNSRNFDNQESIKTLTNPVPFTTPFLEPTVSFEMEYEVKIQWFINPNDFYVSFVFDEDMFKNVMMNVPSLYSGVKPAFNHEIAVNSSVLARFPEDKALYRAQVLDSQFGGKFKVQFVDYGNKCMIDGSDIWQLENDLMAIPKMAIHCSLKGITSADEEWKPNTKIDDCFSSNVCKAIFHSMDTNKYIISLVDDNSVDVAQKLLDNQLAVSTDPVKSLSTIKVYITHVDTPGQFWLQFDSDTDKINSIQDTLVNADNFADYSEREVGKLCVSKYSADEQFYRSIILDSDNDIITVRFIDYGNTDVLDNTPGILKCLPEDMHTIDAYALKCSVNATPTGTGQWTEQSSEVFTKLIGDTEDPLDAVIILKGATTYVDLYVNSTNVTDQLVSEGYAVKSEKSDKKPTCFASHINSPSEFWLQLESSVHDLEAISEELINAEEFEPLSEIAEEVICAAKFPEDDLWYRAQIIIHGSDGTEVLFMDYGNASLTNDLRSLPDSLRNLPALSRKCALQKPANIKNWSKEAELKFAELAAEGATVFQVSFIASGDTSIVELYIDGKSVTELLSSLCKHELSTSPVRLPVSCKEDTALPVFVCHSNSPEDFWIHYSSSTDDLDVITTALESGADFEPLENIADGVICASIFSEDDLYYRSKIISHGESGSEVFHIDFGSTAVTSDLRELPKVLNSIPALAKHCTLQMPHDRSKVNEEIHQKFADLTEDDSVEYYIEILNAESDPMVVKLFLNDEDVAEILNIKNEDEQNDDKHTETIKEEESNKSTVATEETKSVAIETESVIEATMTNIDEEKSTIEINLSIDEVNLITEATSSICITEHSEETDVIIEKFQKSSGTNAEITINASNDNPEIITSVVESFTEEYESKSENIEMTENFNKNERETDNEDNNEQSSTNLNENSKPSEEEENLESEVDVVQIIPSDENDSNSNELESSNEKVDDELNKSSNEKVDDELNKSSNEKVDDELNKSSNEKVDDELNKSSNEKVDDELNKSSNEKVDDELNKSSNEKVDDELNKSSNEKVDDELNKSSNEKVDDELNKSSNEKVDDELNKSSNKKVDDELNESSNEKVDDDDAKSIEEDLCSDIPMCDDEDNYSDISNSSEPLDPVKEIKACLDACAIVQDEQNSGPMKVEESNHVEVNECTNGEVEKSSPKEVHNNILSEKEVVQNKNEAKRVDTDSKASE